MTGYELLEKLQAMTPEELERDVYRWDEYLWKPVTEVLAMAPGSESHDLQKPTGTFWDDTTPIITIE